MREIKFRGKRIDTREWAYGFPVMVNGGWFMLPFGTPITQNAYYSDRSCYGTMGSGDIADLVGHDVQDDNGSRMCQIIDSSLCQFTGLNDRKGIDIFEGDIVQEYIMGDLFQVVFTDYANFGLKPVNELAVKNLKGHEYETIDPSYASTSLTVVGNIYDNPELLK